jgi:hypothetical protein
LFVGGPILDGHYRDRLLLGAWHGVYRNLFGAGRVVAGEHDDLP